MNTYTVSPVVVLLLSLFLTACGGGGQSLSSVSSALTSSIGQSSSSSLSNHLDAPSAVVMFPTAISMTEAANLVVRGTAKDDHSTISKVSINGVAASTTDGFANWQVRVPLIPGRNDLRIQTQNALGNTAEKAAELSVTRNVVLVAPRDIAVDVSNNQALVLDASLKALVAIDLTTGARRILSGPTIPNGTQVLVDPCAMTVDAKRNRALVIDNGYGIRAIIAVDLSTGARQLLATYDLQLLDNPRAITLDESNNVAYITDDQSVVSVALATGLFNVLSDHSTYDSHHYLSSLQGIAFDPLNKRVLVQDTDPMLGEVMVAINIQQGSAVVESSNLTNNEVGGLVVDSARNRALLLSNNSWGWGQIVAVDFAASIDNRRVLSDANIPNGNFSFARPTRISLDEAHNRALVLDQTLKAVIAVDLVSGARSLLSGNSLPQQAAPYYEPASFTLDTEGDRILLMDENISTLYQIDLTTSERRVVSQIEENHGTNAYQDMVLDKPGNRLLIADTALRGISAINLANGQRSMLWGGRTAENPDPFYFPNSIALDAARNRLLVSEASNSLIAVDLVNGAMSQLVDQAGHGVEGLLPFVSKIAVDDRDDRALLVSPFSNQVMALDLRSGKFSGLLTQPLQEEERIFSIALDRPRNRALLLATYGNLVTVDLSSGLRQTIVDVAAKQEIYAEVLAVDEIHNRAFLLNKSLAELVIVDLVTGERVTVSR